MEFHRELPVEIIVHTTRAIQRLADMRAVLNEADNTIAASRRTIRETYEIIEYLDRLSHWRLR
jgi:hypothetical protein